MNAKVVHCRLEAPLEPVALEPGQDHALLVASLHGTVLGEALVSAHEQVSTDAQERAIADQLGDRLWEERLRTQFERAARAPAATAAGPAPDVSVVVCTTRAERELQQLRDSLQALDPPAREVLMVESRRRGVAAAQGEIVAFVEDDSIVDPRWLAGLEQDFADPLVMAVVGYTAPLEFGGDDTAAGPRERGVYDIFSLAQPRVAETNCFVRRAALGDEDTSSQLYQRLIETGYRLVSAPAHIAWRRGPRPKVTRVRARRARGELEAAEPPATSAPRVVQPDDPPLSVAIASYNRRERLAQVLTALGTQSYPADRYEVVVILDGSTDGSAERARALDLPYELRLVEQENRGLAASRNRGWHESEAPVVVFLDDDIVPERDFVAAHASAHRDPATPSVALGTCPPADLGQDLISLRMRHWWTDYYRRRSLPDHQWTYADFGDGNVSFRREVLLESGGWDEQFARETVRRQDWEFGIRLLRSGVHFIDCPDARGLHHFDPSFATALRNRRVEGRSDVLLATKHPQVRGHLFLVTVLRMAAASRRSSLRLTARSPRAASLLLRPAPPVARLFELAHMRSLAWRAMPKLLANSYLAGVRDVLPTREQFRDFVAPIRDGEAVERAPLHLDREGTFELPTPAGAVELELMYRESTLARVEALEPEMHWDWDALEERVVREALGPYRAAAEAGEVSEPSSVG